MFVVTNWKSKKKEKKKRKLKIEKQKSSWLVYLELKNASTIQSILYCNTIGNIVEKYVINYILQYLLIY